MQQPFSVQKYLRRVFRMVLLIFGIVSLLYSIFMSFYSTKSTLSKFSVSMQSYMDKLSSDLQVESDFNRTIATSDPNFALISTNSASDAKRLPPLYHLRQIINYHDNEYCVNMIADSQKDDVYYLPSLLPTKKLQLYGPPITKSARTLLRILPSSANGSIKRLWMRTI